MSIRENVDGRCRGLTDQQISSSAGRSLDGEPGSLQLWMQLECVGAQRKRVRGSPRPLRRHFVEPCDWSGSERLADELEIPTAISRHSCRPDMTLGERGQQ